MTSLNTWRQNICTPAEKGILLMTLPYACKTFQSKFKIEACIKPKNVIVVLEPWKGRGTYE